MTVRDPEGEDMTGDEEDEDDDEEEEEDEGEVSGEESEECSRGGRGREPMLGVGLMQRGAETSSMG